ncbi:Dph6-related ATP pyrophosphatase [Pontibacter oryzae]|uniref:Diphthine--ammonia ligase n=1 Tax=Pontibacter oryzae TaxID=2304593 RepID=A0A399SHH2_9BACT|nr:diphthine--ammonia ligase [Pontibacter oryzae]RIJ42708.1 diphthine--ammonia ligase [Pontibacter oryzae]
MAKISYFNWSGGKDSSLCLYHVLQQKSYTVSGLLTTLSGANGRVTMHGVREELLDLQAKQIGLPLQKVYLPEQVSMQTYNRLMLETMQPLQKRGVTHAIFGDINLEDLRAYREQQLEQVGMQAAFPLWGRATRELVEEFIALGFKAVVVCVNDKLLDKSFAGRQLDKAFLNDLPPSVDPAGENGEFHTFVYDGPIFKQPLKHILGEVIHRSYAPPADPDNNCFKKEDTPTYDTGFWFCDLLPA